VNVVNVVAITGASADADVAADVAAAADAGADLHAPSIAWPTIALAFSCIAAFVAVCVGAVVGVVALPVACALSTIVIFAAFTPVHEAAHRSLCTSNRVINDVVGRACVLLLAGSLGAYRFIHNEHHVHTNEPDADPDAWSGRAPTVLLPLRWATQDAGYIAFYLRHFTTRPALERFDFVASSLLYVAVGVSAALTGHLPVVIACWALPSRLALVLLAWTFDWLPHKPHTITARVDRYRATSLSSSSLLTPLLLAQNYHLVHHLFPGPPFYRLPSIWRARRADLLARGVIDRATR